MLWQSGLHLPATPLLPVIPFEPSLAVERIPLNMPTIDSPRLRSIPVEPHELHRDLLQAHTLRRPMPLTDPFAHAFDTSSNLSDATSAFQPGTPDPWTVIAQSHSERSGEFLTDFEAHRLAATLRERFNYDVRAAMDALEV